MDDYKKAFANIDVIKPKEALGKAVLLRINAEKRRLARIRLAYTSTVGVLSLLAFVPATQYFISQFSQSGFYQYLSLLFSDGGTIMIYWKELLLSLLESLPATSITAILVLVFILLTTSKFIIQDSKIIFNRTQLA